MFEVFDPIALLFGCLIVLSVIVGKALVINWIAKQDIKFIRRERGEEE